MNVLGPIANVFYDASIFTWDVFLTLGNLVWSSRPVGKVTPQGHPGCGGYWPEYRPPQEGDSRSCCPALNAMANHGIFPRSGRGIKFTEAPKHLCSTYNFSPSFCYFACHYIARMLNKNYKRDTFDLEELNLHNGIEHDASLTRLDTSLQPNQSVPHPAPIEELLSFASGKDAAGNSLLTNKDLSRILGKRRAESKATSKEYSLRFIHRVFGSANASTMLTFFSGWVDDLRVILLEEQLPEGWEPRVRLHYGMKPPPPSSPSSPTLLSPPSKNASGRISTRVGLLVPFSETRISTSHPPAPTNFSDHPASCECVHEVVRGSSYFRVVGNLHVENSPLDVQRAPGTHGNSEQWRT